MPLPMPKRVPEPGFYYHYKHDPNKSVNNHAYEVVGVGFHTESNARPGEEHFLTYLPLDHSSIYTATQQFGIKCFNSRPLEMWMENVTKDGNTFPRFKKIEDPEVIAELERIRNEMYPTR